MKRILAMKGILATNGGKKTITIDAKKALQWPIIGREEIERVKTLLQRGEISISEEVYRLEDEFKTYLGSRYALSHNNGTAAIHAAFFALDLGPGDEVITPSYTYWATCAPILAFGGIPVFVEVSPKNCNIDPEDIKRCITKKTKAIIVVHLWGMPCEMDEIMAIARKYRLKVIEDASHAHGAKYKGKKIGTIGDIGCFSFQNSKLMPAGEGGMLVTDNREYYERALAMGHYERLSKLPKGSRYRRYYATAFGYKHRMYSLAAAIARIQLKNLDKRNAQRNKNVEYFDAGVKDLRGIKIFETPSYIERVYYQHELIYEEDILVIKKEKFIEALRAEGAQVSGERYPLQHQQPLYREKGVKIRPLPVTEAIRDKIISVPTFPRAKKALLDQYINAFRKVILNIDELK